MLRLNYVRNFFILTCLFSLYCYDGNSSSAVTLIQNQLQFSVNPGCNINYNPVTSELKLATPITVNAQLPRARCIIRINTSNTQKQFRLVPLAFKGQVKQAPAQVGISSILIGDIPIPTRVLYQSPPSGSSIPFDLTNQILPTNYTTKQKSVLGINLVLTTSTGELTLTDVRFALQPQ